MNRRQTSIYENYRVLNKKGELMFTCSRRRALWYLERGLAFVVGDETATPLTIQLTFTAAGPGNKNDVYYLTPKDDKCVVCGSTHLHQLTQHHIFPRCYRRRLPKALKEHNHHDILPLCRPCHSRYETHAMKLKRQIAEEYGVSLEGLRENNIYSAEAMAVRSARALVSHSAKMPPERVAVLKARIAPFLGHDPSDNEIKELANNPWCQTTRQLEHHGALVIPKIANLQSFVEMWRRHFLETMKPQHMPEYWDLHRVVGE